MQNKRLIFIIFLLAVLVPLSGEIIKKSELKRKKPGFKLVKNIFTAESYSRDSLTLKPQRAPVLTQPVDETEPEKSEKTLVNLIIYGGYIIRESKKCAIVSLNNEYYILSEQETIMDDILVISIEKASITVKVGEKIQNIPLKGEENE